MEDKKTRQFREYLKIKKIIEEDKSDDMLDKIFDEELEQKDENER